MSIAVDIEHTNWILLALRFSPQIINIYIYMCVCVSEFYLYHILYIYLFLYLLYLFLFMCITISTVFYLNYCYFYVRWLFGFYGIPTFVSYLMPNPFLCNKSVLFQTIQFSMSTQFNCQKHIYFKVFSLVKQF